MGVRIVLCWAGVLWAWTLSANTGKFAGLVPDSSGANAGWVGVGGCGCKDRQLIWDKKVGELRRRGLYWAGRRCCGVGGGVRELRCD